ncbi:MAG: transglutaminase family protein [Myxococcota bacterium]
MNSEISDRFRALAHRPESPVGLAEGALVVAAEARAGVDIDAALQRLAELVERVRPQIDQTASPARAVAHLNHWLFEVEGFHGNQETTTTCATASSTRCWSDAAGLDHALRSCMRRSRASSA